LDAFHERRVGVSVFRGGALCGFISREVQFEAYETRALAAVEKPPGAEDGDFRLFVWDENLQPLAAPANGIVH
jgi:hypothetical protein